jgi:hypothetical protein
MPATLFTVTPLNAQYLLLYQFIQAAWEIARRQRNFLIAPTAADSYTLAQTNPVTQQTNIIAVVEQFERLQDLLIKVDDAMSEMTFALTALRNYAAVTTPLPSAIAGPPFGVNHTSTP